MLGSLKDPNTRFVDPAMRRVVGDATQGKFHGIGADLGIKPTQSGEVVEEHLIIIAPLPSGPAEKAGLRAGDDVVAVNGKSVLSFDPYQRVSEYIKEARNKKADREMLQKEYEGEQKRIENGIPILDAENLLASEDKKSIELTITRQGAPKDIKVKVEPKAFTLSPVASSVIDGGYGYIKINCFSENAGGQFGDALRDLKSKNVKGLVVDISNTAGGELDSVRQVAKWLAPGRTLGTVLESRGRKQVVRIPDAPADQVWRGPLVVLVNKGTARMSEVLAAALKDNSVAKLVGQKTYGDFAYSTLIDQADGSAVIITTGGFLSSKGVNYSGKGVPVDTNAATGDPIKEAVKMLDGGKN